MCQSLGLSAFVVGQRNDRGSTSATIGGGTEAEAEEARRKGAEEGRQNEQSVQHSKPADQADGRHKSRCNVFLKERNMYYVCSYGHFSKRFVYPTKFN